MKNLTQSFLITYKLAQGLQSRFVTGQIICYSILNGFLWELNDVGMSVKITFEVFKQFNPVILVFNYSKATFVVFITRMKN